MNRTYTYRLYPNHIQNDLLNRILDLHRELYNAALEERREAWRRSRVSINYYDQANQLKDIRQHREDFALLNFSSCQQTLRWVNKSFDAFFRRVKLGKTPGYPRFKSRSRFKSVTFVFGDGATLSTQRLRIQGVGKVKVKWHRAIPANAKIKQVVITRQCDGWYANLQLELPDPVPVEHPGKPVGIDLGLKNLITLSTGETVEPPKFFRKSEKKLRIQQRRVSRREKFSQGWRKAQKLVAKTHEHIANQRKDFNHKLSTYLARTYSFIAVEDLGVEGLARTNISKSVNDAGWTQLLTMLSYKVENTGARLVKVDRFFPSSRLCPACGCINESLTLADRTWVCACGAVHDRDANAASNILSAALSTLGRSVVTPTWVVPNTPCVVTEAAPL
jgi:putative transposase